MGNGRKRPADQMAADGGPGEEQQHVQTTPRTDKKNKSGRKKKDKKRGTKNKDGSKANGKSMKGIKGKTKDGSSSAGASLETTATAEGKQMAQVLSTFSKVEQSRFEAFRKAAFPGDAISKYVAHCLLHEQHRPVSGGSTLMDDSAAASPSSSSSSFRTKISGATAGATDRDGKAKARFRDLRPSAHYRRSPVLSELVAPGQAGDITVVVSTLAKEYAQRLVLAARRYATERTNRARLRKEEANNADEYIGSEDEEEAIAISPHDLLQAHADRQARGLDPGFFLQGTITKNAQATETSLFLTDPESHQRYSLSRSVALAAQDEYDKDRKKEQEEEENNQGDESHDVDDDAMKVENDDDRDAETMKTEEVSPIEEKEEEGKTPWDEDVDGNEEDKEDPSEQAMRLFSLHVNRMIARQNGTTVVTSDDEGISSDNKIEIKQEEQETKSLPTPTTSLLLATSLKQEVGEAANNTSVTPTTTATATTTPASNEAAADAETMPMDTSSDDAVSAIEQKTTEEVETSGNVATASTPDNGTNDPPEQEQQPLMQMEMQQHESEQPQIQAQQQPQEDVVPSLPLNAQTDAPAATAPASAIESASGDADNSSVNPKETNQEQEVIMIDDD